ncbi:MAG: hypothetical protein P8N94_15595, partial [Gammaproteobacteria bacterium]|nr:hypothetical protein [Gammaproteobacteria bacterium]
TAGNWHWRARYVPGWDSRGWYVREPSFGSTHVTQRYAGVGNNRSYFPSATLRTPAHLNSYQDLARVTGPYSSGLKLMPQNISRDIVYLRNAVPGSDSSSKRVNYWEESPGAYHRWSNNMSRGRDSKESIVWDGAGEAPGEGETPGTNLVVGRQAGRVGDEILWRYNAGSGVWDGLGAAGQAALVTLAGETDPLAFGPKFSYMTVDRFSNSGGGPYLVRGCGNATGARNQVVTVGFRIDPTSSATIFAPWGHSSSWNNNGGLVYNRTDEEFIYVADPAASWLKDANGYYVIDTNGYYVFDPRFNSGNIVPTLTADGSPPVPAVDYSPFTGSGALPTNVVKWSVPEAELRESTTEGKWCVATIMSNGGVVSLYLNESDKGDRSLPSLTNGWQNNGLQMVSTYQYQIGNNRYAVEGGAPGKMDIAWLAVSSNGSSYWGSQPEPQRKLQHAEANWHLRRSTDTGSRRYWAVDFDGIGDFEGEGLGVAPSAHLQMSSLSVYDADVRIERSAMVAFPESPAVVAADLPTSTMAYGQLGRYASAGMPNQAFVDVTLPKTTEIANVGGLGLSSEVSSAQYQLEVSGAAYGYGVSGSGIWADSEDGDGTVKEAEVNSAIERAKPAGSQVWVRYSR